MPKRQPRKVRPNERYEGYDSKFEYDLHQDLLVNWDFHPKNGVPYTINKTYNPDFVRTIGDKTIFIEAKGRFWDSDEYSKYKWIRECLEPNQEIVFLFYNDRYPMPRSRKRKDGSKVSHGEWATSNGFRWFTASTFPEELL